MKLLLLFFIPGLFISNWQEYTSMEGQYRILTPGDFVEKQDTVATAIGNLVYHTNFYQPADESDDNLFYMVSFCDYPEGIVFADSTDMLEEFFQNTMQTAAKSVKGKLLYSTDIHLGQHPGKYWRIDYLDGKAIIKTKAYLAGRRYYAVQTIAYKEKNINPSSEKFFDSFRVF